MMTDGLYERKANDRLKKQLKKLYKIVKKTEDTIKWKSDAYWQQEQSVCKRNSSL